MSTPTAALALRHARGSRRMSLESAGNLRRTGCGLPCPDAPSGRSSRAISRRETERKTGVLPPFWAMPHGNDFIAGHSLPGTIRR